MLQAVSLHNKVKLDKALADCSRLLGGNLAQEANPGVITDANGNIMPGMDPAAMGGMMPPGGMMPGMDPAMMGGMMPGMDPAMMPGMDPAMMGGMMPGMDPAMMGGMMPGG